MAQLPSNVRLLTLFGFGCSKECTDVVKVKANPEADGGYSAAVSLEIYETFRVLFTSGVGHQAKKIASVAWDLWKRRLSLKPTSDDNPAGATL